MNMFRMWMRKASENERMLLAAEVGTSRANLDQYAGGHRQPSPERGIAIERETERMNVESDGRLPRLYRTDLVGACRGCDFAAKCLGQEIIARAEFDVVDSEGGEL